MKPSELIRLALGDLEKCEADPRYGIFMSSWHLDDGKTCEVCLAGAVLAKTLNYPPEMDIYYVDDIPDGWGVRLLALDRFRKGQVESGLAMMKIISKKPLDRMICPYAHKEMFKRDMLDLATDLEKEGL